MNFLFFVESIRTVLWFEDDFFRSIWYDLACFGSRFAAFALIWFQLLLHFGMSFVVSRGWLSWWPGPSFRAGRGLDFVVVGLGLGLGLGLWLGLRLGWSWGWLSSSLRGGFRRRRPKPKQASNQPINQPANQPSNKPINEPRSQPLEIISTSTEKTPKSKKNRPFSVRGFFLLEQITLP